MEIAGLPMALPSTSTSLERERVRQRNRTVYPHFGHQQSAQVCADWVLDRRRRCRSVCVTLFEARRMWTSDFRDSASRQIHQRETRFGQLRTSFSGRKRREGQF